jgi:hypothetical protein
MEELRRSEKSRGGGDGFDWLFLAMIHWRQGRKEEARKVYDKAVAWMEASDLSPQWRVELTRFRKEAEELLGREE